MSIRAALSVSLALLSAGCAATLETQVTAFHQLSDGLAGQRFVIRPTAEQQGSLEFDNYARLVREALVRKGLMDADAGNGTGVTVDGKGNAPAGLGVAIAYGITGGNATSRGGTGGFAGFGFGSGGFSMGSVGVGIGFPIGSSGASPGDSAAYQRTLRVEIDRLDSAGTIPAPGANTRGARVFEARATSEGPSASLASVMPAMVQAVFEEFPGPSGQTRVVRVPLEPVQ